MVDWFVVLGVEIRGRILGNTPPEMRPHPTEMLTVVPLLLNSWKVLLAMNSAQIFDKPENRVLLVVCARKQIRNIEQNGISVRARRSYQKETSGCSSSVLWEN